MPSLLAQEGYEQNDFRLIHSPTICAFEPSDNKFPSLWKTVSSHVRNSVLDWKTKLNEGLGHNAVWKMELVEIPIDKKIKFDLASCDIEIVFKPKENSCDIKLPLHPKEVVMNSEPVHAGMTTLDYENHKARIEIYYLGVEQRADQTSWREGNYIYTKTEYITFCTGYLAGAPQLAMTIRHELGHGFGLPHYYVGDEVKQKIIQGELSMPSIMIDTNIVTGNTRYNITPLDINAIKSIYGSEGFKEVVMSENKILSNFKSISGSWAAGTTSDYNYREVIYEMFYKGILSVPEELKGKSYPPYIPNIPNWLKTNAGWWANNKITDSDFLDGMQYLIDKGIIKMQY